MTLFTKGTKVFSSATLFVHLNILYWEPTHNKNINNLLIGLEAYFIYRVDDKKRCVLDFEENGSFSNRILDDEEVHEETLNFADL